LIYVFDTSSLIKIFGFYPKRFPTLWSNFSALIQGAKIISVREVLKEIHQSNSEMMQWSKDNDSMFYPLSNEDASFLMEIFRAKNGHFQHIIKNVNILKGSPVADPFVIAKAKIVQGSVVTEERPGGHNSTKIPDICKHFDIDCLNLEGLMEREQWLF